MIVKAVLILLLRIAIGFLVAHLIWKDKEPIAMAVKASIAVGLGFGISSLFFPLWAWANLPQPMFIFIEIFLLLGLLFLVWLRERISLRFFSLFSSISKSTIAWVSIVLFVFSAGFIRYLLLSYQTPHGYWDAWSIWNLAARYLYGDSSNYFRFVRENLWPHPDYPLLLSANVAESWFYLKRTTVIIPIIIAGTFFTSIISLMFFGLKLNKDLEQAALGTILFSSLPVVPFVASTQYADLPLAYFFLATVILFSTYLTLFDNKLLILAGGMAGLSAWTKNEGLLFFLCCLIVLSVYSVWLTKNLFKGFLLGSFFPLLCIFLFKFFLAPSSDLFVSIPDMILKVLDPLRYKIIVQKFYLHLMEFDGFTINLFCVLIIYGILLWNGRKNSIKQALLFLFVLIQFVGYFFVYLITPHDLVSHINTSVDRLLFHLLPMTMFIYFLVIPSPSTIWMKKEVGNN